MWGQEKNMGKPGYSSLLYVKWQLEINQSLTYSDTMSLFFHRMQG